MKPLQGIRSGRILVVDDDAEQPLTGGQSHGLVRVGQTVRRPRHSGSQYVQALLAHLEAVGYPGAPRPRGYDAQGREVVSFIEGHVPAKPPFALSDEQLRSATELVRAYHDATARSPLRGSHEVVCHGDLGPHNIVFRGQEAVAIIDWDCDVGPGRRSVDFAHAVWCFADLTVVSVPLAEQARKTRLMCAAYPGMTPSVVMSELAARFRRARDQHAVAGRTGGVEVFEQLIGWVETYGPQIAQDALVVPDHKHSR